MQEAHADDLWPLGFGIQSHKNIEERHRACSVFLERQPAFKAELGTVAVDSMNDQFLKSYSAWPERYYLVDLEGSILWSSTFEDKDYEPGVYFQEALRLAATTSDTSAE